MIEEWVAGLMRFEGVPYHHQGRSMDGIDCIGPGVVTLRDLGLRPKGWDFTAYPRDPNGSLQPMLDAELVRKPRELLTVGDVVLNAFRMQAPRHIAYIVGERYGQWVLLHADARVGKVQVERIQYGRYYRFVQGYGVPGVA